MTNNLNYFLSEKSKEKYPPFLLKKMGDFYTDRPQKEWVGRDIIGSTAHHENSIDLTSNDYLRLSRHPHVLDSQINSISEVTKTPLLSATFINRNSPQAALENRLASFFESETAILSQSGYAANVGLIQSLIEDMNISVYIDMMAHMSIWNGIRLGGGKAVPFVHNDLDYLKKKINASGPGIIVADSIYSTDGSIAPLYELAEITKSKGCILIVDESHSFGTHGPNGKGLVVELGIGEVVLFRTASLAKTFCSRAGLILCPEEFGDFFNVTSKPQIFSSALMPFDISGLNAVLDLVSSEMGEQKRQKLSQNSALLKSMLQELGIDTSESDSHIIALKANSEAQLLLLKGLLEKEGIFGAPFCAPATSKNRPVLRFSLHSELQTNDLTTIASSCKKAFTLLNS